ncbi:hypothetical protein [Neosynechococcus sphagnicola]|uniref:hypothetical protein n=1 Tax=Neosynechococcus sphagnicola TaxID=1501145 RepID=UPI0005658FD2|nr:hypothetical protein [Neosynechococcus sphagnicola]
MNLDSLIDSLRKGWQISLGATSSLIEMLQDPEKRQQNVHQWEESLSELPYVLQDPQKRDERIQQLQETLEQLTQEWATKGEVAEREGRSFVETLLGHYRQQQQDAASHATVNTTATTVVSTALQTELQELTTQVAAIRAELEQLRQQDGSAPQ